MRKLLKRITALAVVGGVAAAGFLGVAAPAAAAENSVTVVQSKSEALEGTVWTYGTPNPETCQVTDTGVHTKPGQFHEAETELRYRYSQVIPGQAEQSHQEYQYSRTVADYKTQYHFAKFTHEKTRTWIKEVPGQKAVYEKFTWHNSKVKPTTPPPGSDWKSSGTTSDSKGANPDQILHQGGGNGSYFYYKTVKAAVPGTPGKWSDWSAYGSWTLWQPVQHTSWQDSSAPLGSPQHHGGGGGGDNFYREWQAQTTGQTRQVPNGSHVETTDWLTAPPAGAGWTQIASRKVVTQEQTDDKTVYYLAGGGQSDTLTEANYTTETPGSPWVKVDEKRFETKAAYTDSDVVTNYSHTYKSQDCTVPPTPANPKASIEAVCGAADITLTNPVTGEDGQITASFVVFVDDVYYDAYSVEGDATETVNLTFPEDSGDHKVEVFQAGTSEWKLIASAESKTDCVVPPTEEPPVVVPPVTPPTDTPKATPPAAPETGNLATTGADNGAIIGFSLLGFGLIAGATGLIVHARRKAQAIPVKSEPQE